MVEKRSSWIATFVSYEVLEKWKPPYLRRLFFKNLRDETGLIVREDIFFIDESESMRTGRFLIGDVVSFYAYGDLSGVEFYHLYEGDTKKWRKKWKKVQKNGGKNEGSKY
jgi:hypothetical protein